MIAYGSGSVLGTAAAGQNAECAGQEQAEGTWFRHGLPGIRREARTGFPRIEPGIGERRRGHWRQCSERRDRPVTNRETWQRLARLKVGGRVNVHTLGLTHLKSE